jgi:hypothetical protein
VAIDPHDPKGASTLADTSQELTERPFPDPSDTTTDGTSLTITASQLRRVAGYVGDHTGTVKLQSGGADHWHVTLLGPDAAIVGGPRLIPPA